MALPGGRAAAPSAARNGGLGAGGWWYARGVFAAPGINASQRSALTALMTEINALPAWRELVATRGWDNAFLAGAEFERYLASDIAATETVLKELGLAG